MDARELAALIDHTMLKACATQDDIDQVCDEAVQFGFASVSINPIWTAYCAQKLAGTPVRVNPTVGFPLGANTPMVKLAEAREAVKNGAGEIDVVINIGAVKSGYHDFAERELAEIVKAAGTVGVKVIIETGYLTNEEKVAACEIAVRAGAAFVKTATGFGPTGATVEDVRLMRSVVGAALGVKAAGGIRTCETAIAMLEAGANRIGTSAGVDIVLAMMPAQAQTQH